MDWQPASGSPADALDNPEKTMEVMLRAVPHITELAVNNRTLNMKKRLRRTASKERNQGMMMTLESRYPVATQVISSTDAFSSAYVAEPR